MLNLHRLLLLHEFRLRGTVAAVAEALSYSPSTVSQQLAILEREAGIRLFVPVGRRLQLTPAGEQLADRAAELLALQDQIQDELRDGSAQVTGTIRLSALQSTIHTVIPMALAVLEQDHPRLRVELFQLPPEQALFELAGRRFDLVVAEQYPGRTRHLQPDFDYEPLCDDPMRVAVPAGSPASSLAELRDAVWVMEPLGTAARDWAVQQCRAAGFEPDVRYQTDDLGAHRLLIQSGLACGILPGLFLGSRAEGVTQLNLADNPERRVFTTARKTSVNTPALVACREALRRAIAQLDAGD
ncbi:LysR family transcriptional regulator [Microlunatus endophyticus]|uniref:LysR family transcriptional regulator n=1 Tax=Microlunatus endophyticus TaxID=1716077 RepID=A0A917S780_9ACTN|nr:LysR family transcriptional regulator [Microlunatus endophyticus]GGL59089.1 LysR family transcriptional regulator [Microlunatus endophyticus]